MFFPSLFQPGYQELDGEEGALLLCHTLVWVLGINSVLDGHEKLPRK